MKVHYFYPVRSSDRQGKNSPKASPDRLYHAVNLESLTSYVGSRLAYGEIFQTAWPVLNKIHLTDRLNTIEYALL
jgi:hypothetical protein